MRLWGSLLVLVPLGDFEDYGEQDSRDAQQAQERGYESRIVGDVQVPPDTGGADGVNRGPYEASDSFFQNGGSFRFWRV